MVRWMMPSSSPVSRHSRAKLGSDEAVKLLNDPLLSNFAFTVLCLGVLVLAALAFLFRAIGRRVREDYQLGREQRMRHSDLVAFKSVALAIFAIFYGGFVRHEWLASVGFALFGVAMSATIWLNKLRASRGRQPAHFRGDLRVD